MLRATAIPRCSAAAFGMRYGSSAWMLRPASYGCTTIKTSKCTLLDSAGKCAASAGQRRAVSLGAEYRRRQDFHTGTCGQRACTVTQQVSARLWQHILAIESAEQGAQLLRITVQEARDGNCLLDAAADERLLQNPLKWCCWQTEIITGCLLG
jgi:hypothetical protein